MGVVYSAEDTRLGRPVALKLPLPAHRLDSSAKERVLHEARSVAALDHPSVCSVYEVGGEGAVTALSGDGALHFGDHGSLLLSWWCGRSASLARPVVLRPHERRTILRGFSDLGLIPG
jgi:serine/threonine protein kinase